MASMKKLFVLFCISFWIFNVGGNSLFEAVIEDIR